MKKILEDERLSKLNQNQELTKHIASVRQHVIELSQKKYDDII